MYWHSLTRDLELELKLWYVTVCELPGSGELNIDASMQHKANANA